MIFSSKLQKKEYFKGIILSSSDLRTLCLSINISQINKTIDFPILGKLNIEPKMVLGCFTIIFKS